MSFLLLLFCGFASVFFRVRPWLILMLRQPSLTLPALNDMFCFRVIPWLILMLCQPSLTLPALNDMF